MKFSLNFNDDNNPWTTVIQGMGIKAQAPPEIKKKLQKRKINILLLYLK